MPDLNLDAAADAVRSFLADYLADSAASGYVVGVSGGLDSALAAHLLVDAVGPDRVTGLILPADPSNPENIADARELCEDLGIEYRETDIQGLVDDVTDAYHGAVPKTTYGNAQARIRMTLLFQAANAEDLLVVGPNNRSELLLGYFTKYGDGAADVAPLADLYKTEGFDLARLVGVSDHIVEKTPSAELWEGQTDPGELGATYETIDPILRAYVDDDRAITDVVDLAGTDRDLVEQFVEMYETSQHKRERPPSPGIR